VHIAVIIPAFNAAAYLRDAMISVTTQTYRDWTMIVVDDGSIDATADVARTIRDPRISLIRQANAGVSAVRNRGIAASAGDACVFLDADDWLAPDALARLAAALDASPQAKAASGGYARVTPGGSVRIARPPPAGALLERLLVRNLFANGGHLLIRRRAIEAAGGFRTDLCYGEDWEYWTRLALQGSFASVGTRTPVLFVRETPGSAYLRMATDPACCVPSLDAIYVNPSILHRVKADRLRDLRRRAEAEMAWVIGRELIRHGHPGDGWRWLGRSLRQAPTPRRVALAGLSLMRMGPFRPYQVA
jgi:glycosyltransferase involved in cell wall biosynthesis